MNASPYYYFPMNESDYLQNEGGQKEKFNENEFVRRKISKSQIEFVS